jgi:dihydroceramidase
MPFLPSIFDQAGYWGKVTATVDFCESNYIVTRYVAELFNTISNLAYVWLGALALRHFRKGGLPRRAQACCLALILIGVGSGTFHASLKQATQMCDDIPMMTLVSVCLYAALQNTPTSRGFNPLLALFLTTINVATILCDVFHLDPRIHYTCFGFVAVLGVARVVQLSRRLSAERGRQCLKLFGVGVGLFAVAFLVWNIDNIYCDSLLWDLKRRMGLPWSALLELHAYWCVYSVATLAWT